MEYKKMRQHRLRIAILASGSGTTAEAVAQATQQDILNAEIALIVYNNPSAGIVQQPTIQHLNIPCICINGKTHPGASEKGSMTDSESRAILHAVQKAGCELVVLLGYAKRVRGELLETFGYYGSHDGRMLNTHPGPLPQTQGLYGHHVHEKVYELFKDGKLSKTGPTLHQVGADYDDGPVVQYADEVILSQKDSPHSIEERVREVERRMTPVGINTYIRNLM